MRSLPVVTRIPLRRFAVLLVLAAAACTPSAENSEKGEAKNAVPVAEVRAQVQKFGMGGGEKDEAGEQFYNWGPAAYPALAELVRDPTVPQDELDTIMFIVATQAHTPELFAALRTRIEAMPDAEARDMRLRLLQQYEAMPSVTKP